MARQLTVEMLARECGLDADIALVTLWGAGIEEIEDADRPIPERLQKRARRALGQASPREQQQVAFWEEAWGLNREDTLARLLDEYGVHVSPNARTLPAGALKRLRRSERPLRNPTSTPTAPPPAAGPRAPFLLNLPGKDRATACLQYEDVVDIHHALVDAFLDSGDPIDPPGVRDENLLHSAVGRPHTSLGDTLKYDTVEGHAAALLHSLVNNHPFHNGNKRTALVAMLVLLDRNNILLTCDQQALFKHVLQVAQHTLVPVGASEYADREVQAIAQWIHANSRCIEHGDRLLTWRELRRILDRCGCTISTPLPGNKVRIERVVKGKKRLGLIATSRTVVHITGYRNDGSEVGRRQLVNLRKELQLSEADGYDAGYFYGNDRREPDEFIAEYSTILRRLGRL